MSAIVLKRRHDSEPSTCAMDSAGQPLTADPTSAIPVLLHLPSVALSTSWSTDPAAQPLTAPTAFSQSKPAPPTTQQSRRGAGPGRKRDYRVPIREWRQLVWQSLVGLALIGFFVLAYMLVTGGSAAESPESAATGNEGPVNDPPLDKVGIRSSLPLREESTPPLHQPAGEDSQSTARDAEIGTVERSQTRIASRPVRPPATASSNNRRAAPPDSYDSVDSRSSNRIAERYRHDVSPTAPVPPRAGSTVEQAQPGRSSAGTRTPRRGYNPHVRLQGIEPPPLNKDRSRQ